MNGLKFWNWTKNENDGGRILRFDGVIGTESWLGDEITPQQFRQELFSDVGDVTIWINSPGGDVIAAAQIYTMMMEYAGEITVKIDGLAASAASVIAMAGGTVAMSPVSQIMIHNPWAATVGDADEFIAAAGMLNETKESIINAYELKTGLSREVLSDLMNAETWMNAKKALEMGFCDEILYTDGKTGADAEAVMFSPLTVQNSMRRKLAASQKAGKPKDENKISVETLKRRLENLKH